MNYNMVKGSQRYFGNLTFYKKALAIALPVMAQLLIQNMVSLIDNFIVAGLGDIKMSGVNIAGQINFIFMVFINTLCVSAGIFMSQFNGAKDSKGMQQSFRFKIIVCSFFAILYTLFCRFIPEKALSLMVHGNSAAPEIIDEGVKYMEIIAWTWIPMVLSNSIASSLREIGRVKQPLLISVVATITNTFFNWIFIYGNLGSPRMEVKGAAIATIIARVVEAIIFIIFLYKTKPPFFSRLREIFKVKISLFISILRKSGLILVSEMIWVLSETVTTALYNSRGGAEIVSGMSAGFALANLFYICFSGIHTATGVIMGGALGAGRLDEARVQKNWLLTGSLFFGIFMGILGCCAIFLIPIVFGNLSSAAQVVTRGMVLVNAFYMPVWAYVNAQFAVSRTGGDAMMGVVVDVFTNTLMVIPGMFALTYLTPIGPVGMYAIIKISDFVKICIAHFWLKKEKWVTNLTV